MPKLSALDFTDLYVRVDDRLHTDGLSQSRYAPTPRRGSTLPRNMAVPDEYEAEIDLLRTTLIRQEHDDFALDIEGMRLRASRCDLFGDQRWVALRRLPLDPPRLDTLGYRPEILNEFKSWGNRSGLIVVGGATRAGKTTTAVGLLTEFQRMHGGVAVTIEDPVEFYLQGPQGEGGYSFQREVHADHQWGEAVKTALRWAPRYIFLGEVRTPGAAKWLLRAATSGHLALCTVHGGSIEETLSAILQIAGAELGETAPTILADGICAVVHQSIVQGKPNVHVLSTDPVASDPVRVAIRSGKLQTLGTEIEKQSILRKQGRGGDDGDDGEGRSTAQFGGPARPGAPAARPQGAGPRPAPARSAPPPPPPKKKGWFG